MTPLPCHTALIICHCHTTLRVVISWKRHIQEDAGCPQSEHPCSQEGVGRCRCSAAAAQEEHRVSAALPLKGLAAGEERREAVRVVPFWLPSFPRMPPPSQAVVSFYPVGSREPKRHVCPTERCVRVTSWVADSWWVASIHGQHPWHPPSSSVEGFLGKHRKEVWLLV